MIYTSTATYARAFNADSDISSAAGQYENTPTTKIAKGIIAILTFGIGYGIIRLIEKFGRVDKKIEEFCINAPFIHEKLSDAVINNQVTAEVELTDNRKIIFEQYFCQKMMCDRVRIYEGEHEEFINGTLEDICVKFEKDFEYAPSIYRVSENYKTLFEKKAVESNDNNEIISIASIASKYALYCKKADDVTIKELHKSMNAVYKPEYIIGFTKEDKNSSPTIYFKNNNEELVGHFTAEHRNHKNIGFTIPYRGADYSGGNIQHNGLQKFYEIFPRVWSTHLSRSHFQCVKSVAEKNELFKLITDQRRYISTIKSQAVEIGIKFAEISLNNSPPAEVNPESWTPLPHSG